MGHIAMVRCPLLCLFFSVSVVLGMVSAAPADSISVTSDSASAGGSYDPKNVVVVWVEDSNGNFVRTLGRWAQTRRSDLRQWYSAAGSSDVDGVSGATRSGYNPISVSWDMTDRSGQTVADGNYVVWLELTDDNNGTRSNLASFGFAVDGTAATANHSANGFNNVVIEYTGRTTTTSYCGDGTRDSGEDCDGSDLGISTCVSLGYESGTLVCTASCALDPSGCVRGGANPTPPCPDGSSASNGCDTKSEGTLEPITYAGCQSVGATGLNVIASLLCAAWLVRRRRHRKVRG